MDLKQRIFRLLSHFDLFDYPIQTREIRSLLGCPASEAEAALGELIDAGAIESNGPYHFFPAKPWSVDIRLKGEEYFKRKKGKIRAAAMVLAHIPFVRGILLTGSMAKGILSSHDDYDFLIIARQNRLWICRAFIFLFRRLISLNNRNTNFKYFCCNYYLGDQSLEIPENDPFTALELVYAQPLYNFPMYLEFISKNRWVEAFYMPGRRLGISCVRAPLGWIKRLVELAINLVWRGSLEKRLADRFCAAWTARDGRPHEREVKDRAGPGRIKPDFGLRRRYILDTLHEGGGAGYHSSLATHVMLRTYYQLKEDYRPRLLLTHAFYLAKTKYEKRAQRPYAPLGPLYVAARLKSRGFKVDFFDPTFRKGPSEFLKHILRHSPGLVGIYVMETTRRNAVEMIKACRATGTVVIVGGPDPSASPQYYIENGAWAAVVGEGEETLLELMDAIVTGKNNIHEIEGVYFAGNRYKKRRATTGMDTLPLPDRSLVDFTPYFRAWRRKYGYTQMQMSTSRGCPYQCSWCAKPVFGSAFRQRAPEKVVEEILQLKAHYRPGRLWFTDDIFGLDLSWLEAFHGEMKKKKAIVPFECLSRVDVLDARRLGLLKAAGCVKIWYGVESGSQKVIDAMNKRFTVGDIREAARLTRGEGIPFGFFIMLGYPGETLEDIELTRSLVREALPDDCGVAIAYPLEGTPFYLNVKDTLVPRLRNRYESLNRLSFRRPYPEIFYGAARRLIARERAVVSGTAGAGDWIKYLVFKGLYLAARKAC